MLPLQCLQLSFTQIINDKKHLNDVSSLIFWWSKRSIHLQQTRIQAQTQEKTIETHEKNKVFGSQITKNDLWFIPN